MYSSPLAMQSLLRLLLGTSVFFTIFSSSCVECFTDAELMAISIGRPKGYPYILQDEFFHNCLDKDVFSKHDKTTWSDLYILQCVIEIYKEDSAKKYSSDSMEDVLDSYCDKWIPVQPCYESITSLINVCSADGNSKGFNSLFFTAAYMNFLCTNKNVTLDFDTLKLENILMDQFKDISLKCYADLKDDIIACVKSGEYKHKDLELCPEFQIVRSCFETHFSVNSLSQSCNSTNLNETNEFVTNLMQSINSTLCANVDTIEDMRQKTNARIASSKLSANDHHEPDKVSSNGSYLSLGFTKMTLILSVAFISCVKNLPGVLWN